MKGFQDLEVYRRASELFPKVYRLVRTWDHIDQREIGSQMIRAANSIHANIAEGYAKTPNDFKRYLNNAIGSTNEMISHCKDVGGIGLIDEKLANEFVQEYEIIVKQLVRLKQNWK